MAEKDIEKLQSEIHQFLEIQSKQIDIRKSEIELEKHRIDAEKETAHKSIEAQLQAESMRKDAYTGIKNNRFWLILVGIIGFLVLACVSLYLNKEALLLELIKISIIAIGGLTGGYSYGYYKGRNAER